MPYIEQIDRDYLDKDPSGASTPGELNYIITQAIEEYLALWDFDYAKLNEVIGVLECAKLELYRRVAAPYEDKKCEENGDVYTISAQD